MLGGSQERLGGRQVQSSENRRRLVWIEFCLESRRGEVSCYESQIPQKTKGRALYRPTLWQVLTLCLRTRDENGGLLDLEQCLAQLRKGATREAGRGFAKNAPKEGDLQQQA